VLVTLIVSCVSSAVDGATDQRLADGALRHSKRKPVKSKVVSLLVETVVAINSEPVEICFVCEHSWQGGGEQVNTAQVCTQG
jgi:hypothetical protein